MPMLCRHCSYEAESEAGSSKAGSALLGRIVRCPSFAVLGSIGHPSAPKLDCQDTLSKLLYKL